MTSAASARPTLNDAAPRPNSRFQSPARRHRGSLRHGLRRSPAQANLPGPQRLPATQPTAQFSSQPAAQPTSSAINQAHRAEVTYAGGQLSVSASNSSLNQILREISRQTGMKVTGGVADERVFGSYGPAIPAKVLAALLDGTGSNMLLVQSPATTLETPKAPVELVLTPRRGGPTPPNPNAAGFGDAGDLQSAEPQRQGFQPDSSPFRSPPQQSSTPVDPNRAIIPATMPTPTDTTTTDDKSPNGVKTPQQIYEQLLRLRQQQAPPLNKQAAVTPSTNLNKPGAPCPDSGTWVEPHWL